MKNIFHLKMSKEVKDGIEVISISGKNPESMNVKELIDFIECLMKVTNHSIKVVNERVNNGKIKNKKK